MKKTKLLALLSFITTSLSGCQINSLSINPPAVDPNDFVVPVNTFLITFRNGDGTTLFSEKLPEGESLSKYISTLNPTKQADGDNTYTFSKWEPTPTVVSQNQVFEPVFTAVKNEEFTLSENSTGGYTIDSFNRESLATVDIGKYESENNIKITEIAANAFRGKKRIETVNLGNNIVSIGDSAFENCSSLRRLTYTLLDGTTADSKEVNTSITTIGQRAFANCSSLKNITIESEAYAETISLPNSLTTIGTSAFEGCIGIKSITIPSRVSSIGTKIFKSCPNLVNLVVDEDNTYYGSDGCNLIYTKSDGSVIEGCKRSSFESENIISIVDNVFDSIDLVAPNASDSDVLDYVTSITFPENLVSFGKEVFKNNTKLLSITFAGTVKNIYPSTFEGCSNLSTIVMTKTDGDFKTSYNSIIRTKVTNGDTEYVGNITSSTDSSGEVTYFYPDLPRLIYGCTGTNKIDPTIVSIGERAFYKSNIQNIVFNSTANENIITSIGDEAFRECTMLETLKIYFPSVAYKNSGMLLPLNLCRGCSRLTSFVIPPAYSGMKNDETTTKGNGSFIDCVNLTEISIHNNLDYIFENTFNNCRNISKINYSGSNEQWKIKINGSSTVTPKYKIRGNEPVMTSTIATYEFGVTEPFSVGVRST